MTQTSQHQEENELLRLFSSESWTRVEPIIFVPTAEQLET